MIKTIIFDLDGVIVDSEPLHFEAHRMALAERGVVLTLEDYLDFGVAQGDRHLYLKAAERNGIAIDYHEAIRRKRALYLELFGQRGALRPGVIELIRRLHAGYSLAVASSSARKIVHFVLNRFGLADAFRVVVTGDDVERVKPYPDIYEKAIEESGSLPIECVAIEDSFSGLHSAVSAGVRCIVVPCEFTKCQDFSAACVVASRFEDVAEHIDE
ncbi:MAG: HAD-IA family hydrolase [Candidatus Moranbacteria bacterium]|nr:HAD-IA family hydrolase [Candidatus Moranbacteria bacterium]